MAPSTSTPISASTAPHPSRYGGGWRAVAAAPAIVGSLLLLMALFGWLGRWEVLVLLGWLTSGLIVCTPTGERIAVHLGCGFRRPSSAQAAALAPLWAAALRQSGTAAGDVDLYVQHDRHVNAYAAGGRSVAVTAGVLGHYQAHRLTDEEFVAVLVHELGHHGTGSTRFTLASVWLATPWRVAARLLIGATRALGGRQPRTLVVLALTAGVVVAATQAASQQNWVVAGLLAGIAALTVGCPLADAAASRRAELAADRFAAAHGLALPLAAALRTLDGGHHAIAGWSRLLSSHPAVDQRIQALLLASR